MDGFKEAYWHRNHATIKISFFYFSHLNLVSVHYKKEGLIFTATHENSVEQIIEVPPI